MKKQTKVKTEYYSLVNILKMCPIAKYYVIYGERSNGKTFSVKDLILFGLHEKGVDVNGYLDDGSRGAVIRRYEEDFRGNRGKTFYDDCIVTEKEGNRLMKRTKGKWNSVRYHSGGWWLCRKNSKGEVEEEDTQAFAERFSLASGEHDKSSAHPNIKNILFDEFISRMYLVDEFVTFTNVLSTIVRTKDEARVFMCGNTISPYSPYFREMGLTHVKKQDKGTIDVYDYSDDRLKVAVEYSDYPAKKKASDVYFAFDNPKLKMITSGEWEIAMYPHLPVRYEDKDIHYTYFICFEGDIIQCEVIAVGDRVFTYCHKKTTPLQADNKNIVFQKEPDPRPNYCTRITVPKNEFVSNLYMFFLHEQVYYQDNMLGETVRAYLQWCRESS